ncbi:MAG: L,D-transpeptidase family protein, partial [Vulcanimicrobiota bacterium]
VTMIRQKFILNKFRTFLIALFICFVGVTFPASGKELHEIPTVEGKFKYHVAEDWEDLYPIAKRNDLAIEHIMWANGMTGIKTQAGQKLLLPTRWIMPETRPRDGIILNLAERGIYLFKDGKFKKFFPVAIGAPEKWMTPTGEFKIITKVKNPTWLPPEWAKEEKPVRAGPDNPLGDRWMGLDKPGYGIHATNNPVSIGLAASHGCIRMYPELAQELFEEVYINMPVTIVYEPVKVGYDATSKQILIQTFPDVYNKTAGIYKAAQEKLSQYGLLGLVDDKKLKLIVGKKRAIPEPILGSDIKVMINGKPLELSFSPILKDSKIWTTIEILKPLKAVLQWNNQDKSVNIHLNNKKHTLKIKKIDKDQGSDYSSSEDVAYLWKGRTIIPASKVLKTLGVNFQWQSKPEKTLIIYTPGHSRQQQNGIEKAEKEINKYPLPTEVPDDVPVKREPSKNKKFTPEEDT